MLEREGQARELLNDLRICASGLTRLQPGSRHRLNRDDNLTAYAIDRMVYIDLPGIQLVLVVFENKQTRIYNAKSFRPIHKFSFQSDYTLA